MGPLMWLKLFLPRRRQPVSVGSGLLSFGINSSSVSQSHLNFWKSPDDAKLLQKDFDALFVWSVENAQLGNVEKCSFMSMRKNVVSENNTIGCTPIWVADTVNDVGVLGQIALAHQGSA